MSWLFQLQSTHPVAHAVGILSLVCTGGMALGSIKFRGAGLGAAAVLFAGIIVGHFCKPVHKDMLNFVKEFGLILFVFAIGMQLGPGFFSALRKQGLKLNALAAGLIVLTAVTVPLVGWMVHFDSAASLGLFAGVSVNMPALGAATQTLQTLPNIQPDRLSLPALACAVSYPTAIICSIVTLMLLKRILRINPALEAAEYGARNHRTAEPLERRTLVVDNPNLDGVRLDVIPSRMETGVTISRVRQDGQIRTASDAIAIHRGDCLAVVGTRAGLDQFQRVVGRQSDEDIAVGEAGIAVRRVVVTDRRAVGRSIGELNLNARFGVVVTRISRADLELPAVPNLRLQFGDRVQLVGGDAELDNAGAVLGNSIHALNETSFIPYFLGMFFGIALGTMPLAVPGLPQPVRLGLAGGPLIVALIVGRFGRIGRLVCYMPASANMAFRDFGIALFFAAVGLEAGPKFFSTVFSAAGVQWLLVGACLTILPMLAIGIFARVVLRVNFLDIAGLLAGSMTNPPALTFATKVFGSDAPTVAYATVYPLTMLLRILAAQILAIVLCS
ncbi:MAG TPA: putative transporter [Humisphaera sp.]|jgi:putative transport protein|nr:putative transporter [Humisphaera sp.]